MLHQHEAVNQERRIHRSQDQPMETGEGNSQEDAAAGQENQSTTWLELEAALQEENGTENLMFDYFERSFRVFTSESLYLC